MPARSWHSTLGALVAADTLAVPASLRELQAFTTEGAVQMWALNYGLQ